MFKINFVVVMLVDLIKFINDILQIWVDFLDFFIILIYIISDDCFMLMWIFKFNVFGEKFVFVFLEIDFQNIVVGFLPEAVMINFFRIGNIQIFQIVVYSVILK